MTKLTSYIGDDGRVAIYTGDKSEAIEADPHADIGRVLFHSALPYVTNREVIEGTLTLEAGGYDAVAKRVYNIHAHGYDFTPFILGAALNLRARTTDGWTPSFNTATAFTTGTVPMSGTVQLGSDIVAPYGGWYLGKNLQVGVNDTHVTITDVQPELFTSPDYAPLTSFTYDLDYRVVLTNFPLPV
ncbi:MAG: hypothetical protein CMN87_12065 [Stappia sp.]|uniref:hypothetical protein n=1 Tax=Stappia sp. TaxID=1870903 RepID=UPI000C615B97|nr:hypothetical protein [Stappia sp.]MAB00097.1 hypothetical protein [Stappia sp.]MBM20736.1 hypothetical protein [Stappia sp.]|tara:strand:+ start:703 stop:1260 length:558 start_codon:yes stop_codon:yes gene_type:complete